ncbi:MAG TPA: VOC family protein [Pyrinomonadaceae bacterium]|nr:VOC family protein [Pyrinomonadaceae bacterium]
MKLRTICGVAVAAGLALATWTAFTAAHAGRERIVMINKSTPVLHVKSVETSLKFWTERFGFKKTVEVPEGDHLGFVALENGPVEVMYQTYSGMKADPANPLARAVEQGPSFLFMEVSDINAVSDSLKGAEIVQPVHDTFYGSKEIVVKEPGGHFVIFSQMPQR